MHTSQCNVNSLRKMPAGVDSAVKPHSRSGCNTCAHRRLGVMVVDAGSRGRTEIFIGLFHQAIQPVKIILKTLVAWILKYLNQSGPEGAARSP